MKDIPGYEGCYAASEDGLIFSHQSKRFLNPSKNNGYVNVRLCMDGVQKPFKVHKLIAKTFLPNPLCKRDVNHKNGIRYDNRVCNLEWNTRSENIKHSFDCLDRKAVRAENHNRSKIVLDLRTGIYYPCVSDAAMARQMTRCQVKSGIRSKGQYKDLIYA
jgi:hypothetical protein